MVTAMTATAHAAPAAEMTAPAPTLSRGAAALDWIAPVRTWQTVAWEAASLAVAAGYGRTVPIETAAYAGAGALFGMTSLRVHGRCLAQWADTQARYRFHRLAARRRDKAEAGAGVEPLGALLPDLGLGQYVDPAGNRVGLAASDGGWVAAVRLGPTAEPDVRALIGVLREAFEGTTIPLACAQLVVWTAAGPGGVETETDASTDTSTDASTDPSATSNGTAALNGAEASNSTETPDLSKTVSLPAFTQDLATTVTVSALMPDLSETVTLPILRPEPETPPPATPPTPPPPTGPMRVYWLALRYRPRQAPHAALARGGGELGAARAAASAALNLVASLDAAGYPADALDQLEFGQELLVRQTWRDWSTGRLHQVCYLPRRSLDPAELLSRWTPGAAFSCASYTLSRTPRGRVRSESALRIAGKDVAGLAPPVPAVRASGRQQEFVLRTLPLAVC
ncbi:MAG: hypothetical protein AUG49_24320 [Catenulispora sp. 13_1_20CM_3_70_7]|nr:MAG: hypothetical protein AUG49_24320 [Catenulispora sp. 13_1_20CM_3_70_7]